MDQWLLVATEFGLHMCGSVRGKQPGEQWIGRETGEAHGTTWNFDVEMDTGVPAPLWNHDDRMIFQQYFHLHHLRHHTTVKNPGCVDKVCTRKHSGSELSGPKSAELRNALCETPSLEKSHTRECKTFRDAWEESRRTATAEEVGRGVAMDSDTTSGPEFEFNGSRSEKFDTCHREPSRPDA